MKVFDLFEIYDDNVVLEICEICLMIRVFSETLVGFTSKALPPETSGIEVVLEVNTGQPQAMASKIGNPKPS